MAALRILPAEVLRVGRVSVAIRKLVHYSWYGPAGERPSWAGTNWKGLAGQGSAIIGLAILLVLHSQYARSIAIRSSVSTISATAAVEF